MLESIYYAYRATGDAKYQEWAWEAYLAINRTCAVGSGYSSISNVNAPGGGGFQDFQESFWFAEVLKYAYLIHAEVRRRRDPAPVAAYQSSRRARRGGGANGSRQRANRTLMILFSVPAVVGDCLADQGRSYERVRLQHGVPSDPDSNGFRTAGLREKMMLRCASFRRGRGRAATRTFDRNRRSGIIQVRRVREKALLHSSIWKPCYTSHALSRCTVTI